MANNTGSIVPVGKVDFALGKVKYHSDPSNSSTTVSWMGDFGNMLTYYNDLRAVGWTCDLEQDDADVWNLTATYPITLTGYDPGTGAGTEVPEITWDLTDKVANKSLLDLDNETVKLIPNYVATLINDTLHTKKKDILIGDLSRLKNTGKITETQHDAALYVYQHMAVGIKTHPVYVPVLTKTAVSSNTWVINFNQQNKGKIYSTETLIQAENVDVRLRNILPRDVFIQSPVSKGDVAIPKAYGWLKGETKTQLGPKGRSIVTQTWEYGLWPTLTVGNPL